ncbi:DUF4407 domain-containing protein [Ramlibacter sp. AN1015]|uniref:DUF4407 domain-containing protein n=1 Tax=Ramlibacter sp. AN1015 TaxID=3133428 RepID=UPI0030C1B067
MAGEDPRRIAHLHKSTLDRALAFGLAIHIPVLLWFASTFLICREIFEQGPLSSLAVACCAGALVYLVERLVIATPRSAWVSLGRFFLGLVVALLGASVIDLVIFEKEIVQHLKAQELTRATTDFDARIATLQPQVDARHQIWLRAEHEAVCEATGACGSGTAGVGPIAKALRERASRLEQEYKQADAALRALREERRTRLAAIQVQPASVREAGLLGRLEALRQYTEERPAALLAWGLFFVLVLCLELLVVLAKIVFGDTVDDRLELVRERVSEQKARDYQAAMTRPGRSADEVLAAAFR